MTRRPLVLLGVVLALLLISAAPAAAQLPTWVSSQPLWQWFQIPNTALGSNAPPVPFDPAMRNPLAKILSWNGAALKRQGSCYILGAAGGHNDYAGNEVDMICLNTANPQWVQLRGQTPFSQVWGEDGPTSSGQAPFYGDQRPASTHTYWNTHFVDSLNRMLVVATFGLGPCPSAANGGVGNWPCPPANWPFRGTSRSYSFNLATNDWDPPDFIAHYPGDGDPTGAFSTQNPITGEIYHAQRGGPFAKWTPSSTGGSWTIIQSGNANPNGNVFSGEAFDFDHSRMMFISADPNQANSWIIDLNGNHLQAVNTGPAASTLVNVQGYPHVVYDEANKNFLAFFNVGGPPGGTINTVRVDPISGFADFPPITGTPAPARINGIVGALVYVPELGGVVVTTANSTTSDGSSGPTGYDQNMWFMRTSSAGQVIQPTLNVTVNGTGNVTSNVGGINCPAGSCIASFAPGTPVTLTATTTGFTGWSGACAGTQTTCNLTINVNTTVTANFAATTAALTVTKAGTGTGTVTSAPAGITCGATCVFSFNIGQSVVLTESPITGTFTSWTGCDSTTATTCTVAMNAPRTVTATFTVASGGNSYSTTFPTVENPLCEGSPAGQNCKWINGATSGSGFQNMRTVAGSPNFATGAGASLSTDNDPAAVLNPATTGAWGPNQFVRTQIRCDQPNCVGTNDEELEIHLNMTCDATGCHGYEILKCAQIVRWDGPVGTFTPLPCGGTCTNVPLQNGDVFSAQNVNGVITAFQNGVVCNQAIDSTYRNGTPGIGYFTRDASVPPFGFTSFSASDQSMPGGDTTPPSAPSNLAAAATSSTTISLTWTASTDNITSQAFINYFVERCQNAGCTNFVQIAGPLTGVTTFVSGSLTPSTTYLHRVRAQDQAGNFSLTYSNNALATTQSSTVNADADFDARCGGAPKNGSAGGANGVLRCFGFDTSADIPRFDPNANECWGCDYGTMANSFNPNVPVIDNGNKISGAGSMRFNILQGGGSGTAGSWFTHFGPNKTGQLDQGQGPVYIQYSFMWSPELLVPSNWVDSNGAKVHDITLGDRVGCAPSGTAPDGTALPNSIWCPTSCVSFTQVLQNNAQRGFPTIYANCSGPEGFAPIFGDSIPSGGFSYQNVQNVTSNGGCQKTGAGIATTSGCIPFVANQWMTVKVKIAPGQWNSWTSPLKMWFGLKGQALPVVFECETSQPINCGTIAANGWWFENPNFTLYKMGKVFLHPYQTCNNSNGCAWSSNATVWYDELIISTQDIADPGAGTTPPPPSPPTNFHFIP